MILADMTITIPSELLVAFSAVVIAFFAFFVSYRIVCSVLWIWKKVRS